MGTDVFFFSLFFVMAIAALVLRFVYNAQLNSPTAGSISSELKMYARLFFVFAWLTVTLYGGYCIGEIYHVQAHIMEWVHLVMRWAHVLFGIAWIGASFYFIFLENSLNRTEALRDELAGNLWAIHGGGFYYVEKYKNAPTPLPKHLHWFKYEAYFTWLTGFLLLTLVYFMNAKAMLIDNEVCKLSETWAIIISLGALFLGWLIYDAMCRTSLLQRKQWFALVGFTVVVLFAYVLSHLLSGRAAFMIVGALLGTIMAGNVFFCIIPSQKELVAAAIEHRAVNPELGKIAGLRSLHNNYITLPVVFVMISNHFPIAFGGTANWIYFTVITIAGVAVRHFINLYEKGIYAKYMIPAAVVAITSLMIVTAPKPKIHGSKLPVVKVKTVYEIFQRRCVQCHSQKPTDDVNVTAPNGIMFDMPEQISQHTARIMARVVETRTMPQGNKTNITEDEREIIRVWIEQGAKLK